MPHRANQTSFSSERQPKSKRGKSKRTKMLDVLKARGLSENELWDEVLTLGLAGDATALNAFLNRLQPTLKPESQRIDTGVIDEKWLELSHTSRQAYLSYLVAVGELSLEQGLGLASILSGEAAFEADQLMTMHEARGYADNCDKAEQKSLQRRYELHNQMHDDNIRDINQLKELLKAGDTDTDDTDTKTTGDPTDDE